MCVEDLMITPNDLSVMHGLTYHIRVVHKFLVPLGIA